MKRFILASTLVAGLASAAVAQTATIPSPTNPTPDYPVATDGTPLPSAVDGRIRPVYGAAVIGLPAFTGFYASQRRDVR